jgi:hypothetical protein
MAITVAATLPAEPALDDVFRASVYHAFGATDAETSELLSYARGPYRREPAASVYPLPDELFVATWEEYAKEATSVGVAPCLSRRLMQLRFPIQSGISASESYQAATRRGVPPTDQLGPPRWQRPDGLSLAIHPTPAGRIPIITSQDRGDFETLVRAMTRRNEPDVIPASMGACMVAGYNNWDRMATLRRAWAAERLEGDNEEAWQERFAALVPQRELYQDRFIVLSAGPYSGRDGPWTPYSVVIRREHECAHYFTRRVFGSMRNSLVDELIADYAGIVAAIGRYRADWFLHFLGLEAYPACRETGRLHNYRGSPPLSDGAFDVLQAVVVRAARMVEEFDKDLPPGPRPPSLQATVITALARAGLEAMASGHSAEVLRL